MKTKVLLFLLTFCFISAGVSSKDLKDDSNDWKYDIQCAGPGAEGTYLVKVWAYAKNANVASNLLKKDAVHGVIFKGFSGDTGCTSQKPIAGSPTLAEEKADFFSKFFADQGGDYLKYATIVSSTPETVKIGKNDYKVGMVISVSKDLLRKDLEAAGIIKGLSSGF